MYHVHVYCRQIATCTARHHGQIIKLYMVHVPVCVSLDVSQVHVPVCVSLDVSHAAMVNLGGSV